MTERVDPASIPDQAVDQGARAIYNAIPQSGRRVKTWDQAHPDIRKRLIIESRACLAAAIPHL